jgi:outer membrane protein assembly factor BamB
MRTLLLLLMSAMFSLQCDDNSPDPCDNCTPAPVDSLAPRVLWQAPMTEDSAGGCYSMRPIVYNGNVAYSLLYYKDGFELFRMRDGSTGQLKWAWDPTLPGESLTISKCSYDNLLLISHWKKKYCINMNTGGLIWKKDFGDDNIASTSSIDVCEDYLYATVSKFIPFDSISHMIRTHVETSKWDTIVTLKAEDGFSPLIHTPSIWKNSTGEKLLIFQNRQWNLPASKGKIDLYAYNLTANKIAWHVKDFETTGNSNIQEPPLIHEGKIYFQGLNTVHCFDAATGAKLWKTTMPLHYDNLLESNIIVAENLLWVKTSNEKILYALSLYNGQIVVSANNAGLGGAILNYHNGHIYYAAKGDGKLYAYDILNHHIVWSFDTPNTGKPGKQNGATFHEITVDPVTNRLFAYDQRFIMAIELIK